MEFKNTSTNITQIQTQTNTNMNTERTEERDKLLLELEQKQSEIEEQSNKHENLLSEKQTNIENITKDLERIKRDADVTEKRFQVKKKQTK